MTQASFEQFRELVFQDATLQAELKTVVEHDEFVALTVRLGTERGYSFTDADVLAAERAARRAWLERWLP